MNLKLLTSQTIGRIEGWLANEAGPACVFWSGGKDSMVMLHLITQVMKVRLPVVLFREPWWPQKYGFHDGVIRNWGLEVYSPWPVGTLAYQRESDGHLVLIARYAMRGGDAVDVPKDVIEFKDLRSLRELPGESLLMGHACGVDILSRPRAHTEWPWTMALIGHKDVDTDPVLGHIPLYADYLDRPEGTSLAYPLRHWTDADVWAYLKEHEVPVNQLRYDPALEVNRQDRQYNEDWMHACTRCLTAGATETVPCPKYQRHVPGRAHQVAWVETLRRWNFEGEETEGRGQEPDPDAAATKAADLTMKRVSERNRNQLPPDVYDRLMNPKARPSEPLNGEETPLIDADER